MSDAATESSPTTALAALAARATSDPEEPWLFYRRDWDWRWRSFGQVADQVARGAEALAKTGPAVGWEPRQDPDAVALALAAQAAARTLTPELAPSAVPGCRSRLERWQPRTLDLESPPPAAQRKIFEEVGRFDGELPRYPDRWILCATPALGNRDFQVVLAWTLHSGAAWVLESEEEAFQQTVLWARPSLVVATKAELERLRAALAERKHRRHSRLRATIEVGKRR